MDALLEITERLRHRQGSGGCLHFTEVLPLQ